MNVVSSDDGGFSQDAYSRWIMDFDLLVIGQEREGVERAISSARTGRRTAIVEIAESMPFDVLQQAAQNVVARRNVTMTSWRREAERLFRQQKMTQCAELERSGVQQISGQPQFISPSKMEVVSPYGSRIVSGKEIVLACGTQSRFPDYIRHDPQCVFSIESILQLSGLPQKMVVIGGGRTGLASAVMLARLGVEVVVIDEHLTVLELCGMSDDTFELVQTMDIVLRMEEEAIGIQRIPNLQVAVRLAGGRSLHANAVLVCTGREGRTSNLSLDIANVGIDERGRVWCDSKGQTWNPNISVVGDLVAFPHSTATPISSVNSSEMPELGRTGTSLFGEFVKAG